MATILLETLDRKMVVHRASKARRSKPSRSTGRRSGCANWWNMPVTGPAGGCAGSTRCRRERPSRDTSTETHLHRELAFV